MKTPKSVITRFDVCSKRVKKFRIIASNK